MDVYDYDWAGEHMICPCSKGPLSSSGSNSQSWDEETKTQEGPQTCKIPQKWANSGQHLLAVYSHGDRGDIHHVLSACYLPGSRSLLISYSTLLMGVDRGDPVRFSWDWKCGREKLCDTHKVTELRRDNFHQKFWTRGSISSSVIRIHVHAASGALKVTDEGRANALPSEALAWWPSRHHTWAAASPKDRASHCAWAEVLCFNLKLFLSRLTRWLLIPALHSLTPHRPVVCSLLSLVASVKHLLCMCCLFCLLQMITRVFNWKSFFLFHLFPFTYILNEDGMYLEYTTWFLIHIQWESNDCIVKWWLQSS